jgi:CheY-like chemotaxis protein
LIPGEENFRLLSSAEKASMRARGLTQQLLTFARGGSPVKNTASIRQLLKESVAFVLRGSNVKCKYSIARDLWAVDMDEGQMAQVISNLAINAMQAMPEGGTINVKAENITAGKRKFSSLKVGRYAKISIEDQGIGIPEEHLQKVFDPYFTTKKGGSGLGLATAYSIVRNHSGHVEVDFEVRDGTAFNIYLPASEQKAPKRKKERKQPVKMLGKRVLVMDDETDIRESVGAALKLFGYDVTFSSDGAGTVKMYKKAMKSGRPFDAVIMDLTIPGGMGGKEALEKLFKIDPGVRAIATSGYSNDPVMADFKKHGFCNIIPKPYRIEDLSRVLHKVIKK